MHCVSPLPCFSGQVWNRLARKPWSTAKAHKARCHGLSKVSGGLHRCAAFASRAFSLPRYQESDSDEESSKPAAPQYRAAPSQNQQGDAESDSPVSSPAAKPAVLARSPAKVAQLASEEPKDTVPPRLNNITYDSPSPTSPRSGSGSRSGSPVAALPHSPRSVSHSIQSSERNSASAKSPKPQPRARSQSRSRSQSPSSSQPPAPRSRSPSPAPVSTESESSAPVERGSVFGNIRPMSDLVAATPAPSAKNSGMLGAGQLAFSGFARLEHLEHGCFSGQRTATAAFSTQAS